MSTENNINKEINKKYYLLALVSFPIALLILAFIVDKPINIYSGILNIIVSKDVLLTDNLKSGGIGAAFINTSLLGLINIGIIYKNKMKINGALIASVFTVMGFSFLGKNIFNIWPMYIGGLLYAHYQKIDFKSILVVIIFSTALAPLVTEFCFSLNFPLHIGIPLGIGLGIVCGFVITPLAANLSKVHDGYNLYNVGFTAGLIGTIVNSILKSYEITIENHLNLSYEYDLIIEIILFIFSLFLVISGFIANGKSFSGYKTLLCFSGRAITDYTQLSGCGLTLINMGLMGLISTFFVMIIGGTFNGPILGGILTIIGFSAFGKNPKNCIPIFIGVLLAGTLKIWDIKSTSVIIAGLFGTTLAPISGEYGPLAGIFAGFMHLSVVMNVGIIHGGINLYNNGFSGGIVAAVLFPIFNSLRRND